MSPFLGVIPVLLCLPDRTPCDLLRVLVEGQDVVIQRGMLAGGLQAIREDVPRSIAV